MLDLGIDLNLWPWIWLGIAVFFALIELTVLAGSFVLLPFAVSALAAALLGFYDVAIEIQWLVFAGGGALLWILLYRYARNFAGNNELEPGVGADRLIGLTGIVTSTDRSRRHRTPWPCDRPRRSLGQRRPKTAPPSRPAPTSASSR